jgi:hypothetical protein
MSAIGPGSVLICVDDRPLSSGEPVWLVLGNEYVIERVWDYLPHNGDAATDWWDSAVDLVGVASPGADIAWGLYRFRPRDEGISIIAPLVRELEDA